MKIFQHEKKTKRRKSDLCLRLGHITTWFLELVNLTFGNEIDFTKVTSEVQKEAFLLGYDEFT